MEIEPLNLDVSNLLAKSVELERANEDLKVRYDEVQREAEKYKTQLREEKRSKVSIEEKRKGVEEELDRISKKYEYVSVGKVKPEETLEQDAEERKKLREEVIDLKAQIRAYKLEIADHVEDKRQLKDEVEESERKLHEKEKALEKEKSHLHEVETKLHTKEEMLRLNQEEDERIVIMQLENDIADLKQQLEAKKAKKKNVKESKAKLERENKESSRRITSLESQVETLESEVKEAQDKIEELNKKARDHVDVVLALKENSKDGQEEVEKLRSKENDFKQKLEESKLREDKLKNELKELKQQYGEKLMESRSLSELKSEIALHLEEMKSEKFDNEETSEDGLAKVLEEVRGKYEQEKTKTHELSAQVDRLQLELEDSRKYESELDSLKAKLKEVKQKKKVFKAESKDLKKDLDKANREKTEAEEDKHLMASELDGTKQKLKTAMTQESSGSQQQLDELKSEYEEKLKKVKDSKKQLEENLERINERLKQKDAADQKEKQKKQKELDELKKKYDDESKGALAKKERMEDEIKTLKTKLKEAEAEKVKLQEDKKKKQTKEKDSTNGKAAELTDREKALKAQFDRLRELVVENEKKTTKKHEEATAVVENVRDKLDVGREQLAALKRATTRLQAQIDARRDRLTGAGVDELGLLELLEEQDDRLNHTEEDLLKQITERDASSLDRSDALVKSLNDKLSSAKDKNKARVLIEVKQLVKDVSARLNSRLSHKDAEKELANSAEVVAGCKKLQARILHELDTLQTIAQGNADGVRSLRYGWWKRTKGSQSREQEIEAAVSFLITESERLANLRDKYVNAHNKVAEYCGLLNKTEADLAKWKIGLEELQDRVTVGAGWGHAALAARLLACRRILDRHYFARNALDNSKSRRETLRLSVDNFIEGLYVVFSEGIEGLGVRGISELTRIRDLEGQVLAVREELEEVHAQWEEKQQKHKGELVTSHAGALIVETFITHFDTLFDTYDDEDVPELIVKSVDYLLDNALKDKSLLIRDYENPKIKEIRQYFEVGTYDVDLSDCTDHRVIAELLKSFLRDGHDTLLTNNLSNEWLVVDEMVDDNKRLEAISKLLRKLPESNYASLAVIAELLHEVAKRSKVNKCSRRLLARTFGPLLLRSTASAAL